jgi:hypothetical protein
VTEPRFEFLFDMTVHMGAGVPLGATPYGNVSFQHATGGTIDGPRVNGELLPVGGDRVVGRTDGAQEINVQALIRTNDQCHIMMSYRGIIRSEAPESIYWRTAPMFETSAEPYLWMNGILAVGLGGFDEGRVRYRVFGLL